MWHRWGTLSGMKQSLDSKLETLKKHAGYNTMLAVVMMGMGYGSADVCTMCTLDMDTVKNLRTNHSTMLRNIGNHKPEVRAYMLQAQQDRAILSGFALSHNPSLPPRDLRQVASTAAILAKSALPAKPAKGANPPIPRQGPSPVRPS